MRKFNINSMIGQYYEFQEESTVKMVLKFDILDICFEKCMTSSH